MAKELLTLYAYLLRSELRAGLYAWATLVSMIAALRYVPPVLLTLKSVVAMFAIASAVYVYNDISDVELDRKCAEAGDSHYINRPLITKKASKLDAKIFVLAQTFVGLGVGSLVNLQFLCLLALFLVLGIVYSTPPVHLKERFLLKQLTIATGQAISSFAGGAAVGALAARPVIYVAALSFAITFGAAPIVDLRDMRGDKEVGRKTLPIVMGPKVTIRIAMATIVATLLVSVSSYAWLGFNFAFAVLTFGAFLAVLLSIFRISKNLDNPNLIENMVRRVFRPVFFVLHISILVGLIPL